MTKTIQEIQKENRKFILEAIHGCSYDEALKKEIGFGCEVIIGEGRRCIIDNLNCLANGNHLRFKDLVGYISKRCLTDDGLEALEKYESEWHIISSIIGKPITLNRMLLAFKNKEVKIYNNSLVFSYAWERFYPLIEDKESGAYPEYKLWNLFGFDWDLTSETLEQQSEETQREINKILKGK